MTAQISEKLIYEGREVPMNFCPPIPKHPRITEYSEKEVADNIERKDFPQVVHSTACWRRYIGTWEIKGGRLYLIDILGHLKLDGDEPVFADWVAGELRIPQGELLQYVHAGFGSVFEEEILIKIEKGLVLETKIKDNRNKKTE